MDVFISWSGDASHKTAEILNEYLPRILQKTNPFISSKIQSGEDWSKVIAERLKDTRCGIVCVTPDNKDSPWLLFEAGALLINNDGTFGRVMTLLLDITDSSLEQPLGRFQHKDASKEGMQAIIYDINNMLDSPIDKEDIDYTFELMWPDIEKGINEARKLINNAPPKRDSNEMLEELISSSRLQNREMIDANELLLHLNSQRSRKKAEDIIAEYEKAKASDMTGKLRFIGGTTGRFTVEEKLNMEDIINMDNIVCPKDKE